MYLIAGLGNPGRKYAGTRHNMGFETIDRIAKTCGVRIGTRKFKAKCGFANIGGEKVLLVKPQTYMNASGEALRDLCAYYKLDIKSELLVLVDDIALEPGRIRIRKKGSDGGQNGLKNIIKELKTNEFTRIRIGIGDKPEGWDLIDWVLSRPSKEDRQAIDDAQERAAKAAMHCITAGVDIAMNEYNA